MRQWVFDIVSFCFPKYCPVCKLPLQVAGSVLCLSCEADMPFTRYTENPENPVAQLFWGRVILEAATSLFRFEKGSGYQALMHNLKYKGHQDIGHFLGRKLGHELIGTVFERADMVIPVPLHRKKERMRGFNQGLLIAEGVSEITGIRVERDLLKRSENTTSQTRKNRYERWENMEGAFCLEGDPVLYADSRILLVDDVVTTGSTLEACARALQAIPDTRIYVATVACA